MPLNNMRRRSIATIAYVFLTGVAVLVGAVAPLFVTFAAESPRVFILDAELLKSAKDRLKTGDRSLQPALDKILRSADHALTLAPLSVTSKETVPPSGDKHDYMSLAPYWWPNPNTADGLPYVRRDGRINPERSRTPDKERLELLIASVHSLALAYFFTANETYAAQATKMIGGWFLDSRTRMNPNLQYAQAIPGQNQGRGAGIIDSHNLPRIVDAVGLLAGSKAWNGDQQRQLQSWFAQLLQWLLDSPAGRAEAQAENNHGTWYDVQVSSFALFSEREIVAKRILTTVPENRITKQIEPDGTQPRELARTQPWHYSVFNLEALFNAAALGEVLGLKIWNYESADKRSIKKSLDWLLPFAIGEKPWPFPQDLRWEPVRLAPLLQRAAWHFHDPKYNGSLRKLANWPIDSPERLLYPSAPSTTDPQRSP
jgi:hypothetical protein